VHKMYLKNVVKPGDFVEYTPSVKEFVLPAGDGVKVECVFNPSALTKWVVLQNDLGCVELIPAESPGRVILYGCAGWRNLVKILLVACEPYADGEYALSSRTLGVTYHEEVISPESLMEACEKREMYRYQEFGHANDLNQMQNTAVHSAHIAWCGSRNVRPVEEGYCLCARLSVGKAVGEVCLATISNDGVILKEQEMSFDICPAVLMADDVIITGGDGTKDKPYKLAHMRKAFFTVGEGTLGDPYKLTFASKIFK